MPRFFSLALLAIIFSCIRAYAQPANDSCGAAITVTQQPFATSCSSTIAATTANATPSPNTPSCTGIAQCDDDIWYSFTATSRSVVIRITNAVQIPSGTAGVGMAIYENICPVNSGYFSCDATVVTGSGHKIVTGLTIGNVYYLRFWGNSITNDITFNFCIQTVPAAPANDECTGAILLGINPFGTSCSSPVTVNTTGATQSTPNPSCNSTENNDDVWYTFTATSSSVIIRIENITNTITGSTGTSASLALYEGSCPVSTTTFFCENGSVFGNGWRILTGLTIGNTYYLRIWTAGTNNYGSMSLCIQETPAPPVNDECSGALPLIINTFGTACTNAITVNTTGSTASANGPAACTITENNDDVWYSFTATSQSIILRANNITNTLSGSTATSASFALYEGSCPSSTAAFTCDNGFAFGNGWKIVTGLTIGNTYYLRIWTAGINNYGTMSLCVQETPPPPANDNCSGAIPLTINPFGTDCTSPVTVNTSGATFSANSPVACTITENNDDVWYSFTATSQSIIIRVNNITNTLNGSIATSAAFALYEGNCPSSTAAFTCDNGFAFGNGWKIVTGLTIGNTYYLRIWTAGINNYGTMSLCVQETPPPPANDDCGSALALTINPFGAACTNAVIVNTSGATMSANNPTTCTNTENNDDVWFAFTATSQSIVIRASGIINTLNGSTGTSAAFALYSGNCPASTASLTCDNGFAFSSGYKIVDGLVAGNLYYLRIWSSGINNYATMSLCVQEVPPPPVNNECVNAISITPGPPTANCLSPIFANTSGATQSTPNPSCTSTNNNDDIWYSFTATTPTHKLVITEALQTLSTGFATIGYALYSGSCPATTTTLACSGGFATGNGSVNFTGLTVGNFYYLRLFTGGANNYGSFKFCLLETPANNECTGAVNIPVANGFCSVPIVGTLSTATISAGFGVPVCSPTAQGTDVWYKTTVPSTGNLIIQTSAVTTSTNNLVMEAYTGNCGALTLLTCDDDGNPETSPSANHSRIVLTGRTPGEVIYYRVMPFNSGNAGDFVICAWDTTAAVLPAISPGGACVSTTSADISTVSLNRYFWVPILDNDGKIIAEIYADGANVGTFTHSLNLNSGPVRDHAGKFYLDRNLSLYASISSGIKIRIYYNEAELAALQAVDGTANSGNLQIAKSPDSCSNSFGSSPVFIYPTYGSYGSNHYVQFTTNSLSTFCLESKCGSTITWTGSADTNWHNPANWDCGGVPWKNTDVIIPSGMPRYPVISINTEIRSVRLDPGASVNVSTGVVLKVNGE